MLDEKYIQSLVIQWIERVNWWQSSVSKLPLELSVKVTDGAQRLPAVVFMDQIQFLPHGLHQGLVMSLPPLKAVMAVMAVICWYQTAMFILQTVTALEEHSLLVPRVSLVAEFILLNDTASSFEGERHLHQVILNFIFKWNLDIFQAVVLKKLSDVEFSRSLNNRVIIVRYLQQLSRKVSSSKVS